jgi:hypothetical protein
MDLVPHHLQFLCVFAYLPDEWYCMDVQPFAGLIFFNIDDSLVDRIWCLVDDGIVTSAFAAIVFQSVIALIADIV